MPIRALLSTMPNYIESKEETTSHHARELIYINAGGKRYVTLIETLAESRSSYFLNFIRVNPRNGQIVLLHDRFLKDENGAVFVNRDGKLFAHVLQYMRDGKNTILPRDLTALFQLKREAEFFGIESFRSLIQENIMDVQREEKIKEDETKNLQKCIAEITKSYRYNNI